MNTYRMTRQYTSALLDLVDEGAVDKDELIRSLVGYLSEQEVQDFMRANDIAPWLEDEEEVEE